MTYLNSDSYNKEAYLKIIIAINGVSFFLLQEEQ